MKKKIIIGVVILALGFGVWKVISANSKGKTTYETATAEKGSLISSISSTGSITSSNNTSLTTRVSGVVDKVYVTNGDRVAKGQKIASVIPDEYASERQASAWVDYLKAVETAKQALVDKTQADIDMWNSRQAYLDAQDKYNNNTGDNETQRQVIIKSFDLTYKAFKVAETKYLDADANIVNANAQVAAALRDYQENSSTIVAPISGTISDLALAPGLTLSANSSTSNTSGATIVSSQTVGKISSSTGQLIATVNSSEVDILKVKANQKVILTLDAYIDKAFTGKVLAVNTTGVQSSGVTNYPVSILLDPVDVPIYTNMAVTAQIITNIKTDVVTIPTTAITTSNGVSTVQIMKNNNVSTVTVTLGDSNDSQTEIVSGIAEGDKVVTATINSASSTSSSSTTSPFSGIGRTNNTGNNRNTGGSRVFMGGPGGF